VWVNDETNPHTRVVCRHRHNAVGNKGDPCTLRAAGWFRARAAPQSRATAQPPNRTNAQTHSHTNAQTPKRPNARTPATALPHNATATATATATQPLNLATQTRICNHPTTPHKYAPQPGGSPKTLQGHSGPLPEPQAAGSPALSPLGSTPASAHTRICTDSRALVSTHI
jgi:hypothetical protein